MIWVSPEAPVNGMAGVTDRDLRNQEVNDRIHQRRGDQSQHGDERPVLGEEKDAAPNADRDNQDTQRPIEVFLNV